MGSLGKSILGQENNKSKGHQAGEALACYSWNSYKVLMVKRQEQGPSTGGNGGNSSCGAPGVRDAAFCLFLCLEWKATGGF